MSGIIVSEKVFYSKKRMTCVNPKFTGLKPIFYPAVTSALTNVAKYIC